MAPKKTARPAPKATKKPAKAAGEKKPVAESQPIYSRIEILNQEQHSGLKLATKPNYNFAKGLSSIVLSSSEFASAALHYPIVFAEQNGKMTAFAVMGYKQGENVYVSPKGEWREDYYIPAFVRRYPFILSSSENEKTLSLCIDSNSSLLDGKSGDAIYAEGKPSATAQRAVNFCKLFHDEMQGTNKLLTQIADTDILDGRSADITLPGGGKSAVTGFMAVNERKLMELDADTLIGLRNSGALSAIYCHLLSMRVWKNLLS